MRIARTYCLSSASHVCKLKNFRSQKEKTIEKNNADAKRRKTTEKLLPKSFRVDFLKASPRFVICLFFKKMKEAKESGKPGGKNIGFRA
jgi:hypothetical protein